MTATITATVGREGANHPDDVRKIQELLNAVPEDSGGPRPRLAVNGLCDRATLDGILRFQSRPFFGAAYGWVDPGGRTLEKLNEFAAGRVSRPTWIERNLVAAPTLRDQKFPLLFSPMWELIQRKHVHNAASLSGALRVCSQSSQPDESTCDMDERQKRRGWLRPGEAAVALGTPEEREVEKIPAQLRRFL